MTKNCLIRFSLCKYLLKPKANQIRLTKLKKFQMTEEKNGFKEILLEIKTLCLAYGFIQLGSSFVSALALAAIAFWILFSKKRV